MSKLYRNYADYAEAGAINASPPRLPTRPTRDFRPSRPGVIPRGRIRGEELDDFWDGFATVRPGHLFAQKKGPATP